MTKIKYIISIILGLTLGAVAASTDNSVLIFLSKPVSLLLGLIENLSLSSFIGNIIAWCLIIIVSFLPLAIIYIKKKKKLQLVLFGFVGVLLLSSILMYFNPKTPQFASDVFTAAITFQFISVAIALVFELFIRDTDRPERVLHILILFLMVILSSSVPFNLKEALEYKISGPVSFIVELYLLSHLIHLLHLIDEFLLEKQISLLQDSSITHLKNISKYANHMLSYSIYATIFLNTFKFVLMEDSINFNLNIPYLELVFTSVIALFMHLMIQAVSVKKENDQFI